MSDFLWFFGALSVFAGGLGLIPSLLLITLSLIVFFSFIYNKRNRNKEKPKIIGVICDFFLNKNNEYNYSYQPVNILREQYIKTIYSVCSDFNVTLIAIPIDSNQIDKYSQIVDGVIFTGGSDIDAKYFNQEKHPKNDEDTIEKTEFEIKFLKKLLDLKKPIFLICRGMQLINIIFGGDIIQDIPSYIKTETNHNAVKNGVGYLDKAHTVKTTDNSLLRKITNKKEFWVNSHHHQALGKLGKNIIVTGISPTDNIIEAIELKNYPNFLLGVQWHPEFVISDEDKNILKTFCKSL